MTLQGIKSMDKSPKPTSKNGTNHFDHVLKVIYESVADLNQRLAKDQRIEPSPSTVLFGTGGSLDSLGLANFIVIAEEKLDESLGFPVDLTEDDPFSSTTGHFRTILALATYISELIANRPQSAVR